MGAAFAALTAARSDTALTIAHAIDRGRSASERRDELEADLSTNSDFLRALGFYGPDRDNFR